MRELRTSTSQRILENCLTEIVGGDGGALSGDQHQLMADSLANLNASWKSHFDMVIRPLQFISLSMSISGWLAS